MWERKCRRNEGWKTQTDRVENEREWERDIMREKMRKYEEEYKKDGSIIKKKK